MLTPPRRSIMTPDMAHSILALAVGIPSSTTFVAMNATLNYIAFPAYYLPSVLGGSGTGPSKTSPESSPALLLRQWSLTYRTGHVVGPTSVILSTISFFYAAWTGPDDLRFSLYIATASAAIAFPFTVAFILPVNLELFKQAHAVQKSRDAEEQDKVAGAATLGLIAKCLRLSKIRAVMPVPTIGIGMYCMHAMAARLALV
jgi:hypothetical protein